MQEDKEPPQKSVNTLSLRTGVYIEVWFLYVLDNKYNKFWQVVDFERNKLAV